MNPVLLDKLTILAESAKYDVSCSSSGTTRKGVAGGVGSAAGWGICHSFADDGRCISLLKILFTNACMYDCAYCVNRSSNDVPRASFSVEELVELTIGFYRRNYIEGLFLSSAVVKSPDHTMERMIAALRVLRRTHRFNGYIHMKSIPGASRELVHQAGLYADRLSVNIEIPSESNLKRLAPGKDHSSVYKPMLFIRQGVEANREERRKFRHAPRFAPAGQSTQLIIGASNEHDRDILKLSSLLYQGPQLKRVYYSGYIPVNTDSRLPARISTPPLVRENRLYQADWLMRLYHFDAAEILEDTQPDLDLEIDPKLAWALRHPEFFPLDVNRADYEHILRVPGIGLKSAQRIIAARKFRALMPEHLRKLGVVMKRAKYFIHIPHEVPFTIQEAGPAWVRQVLTRPKSKKNKDDFRQLSLFDPPDDPRSDHSGSPFDVSTNSSRATLSLIQGHLPSRDSLCWSYVTMDAFLYDKTFEGLLSAVFDAFSLKRFPDALFPHDDILPLLVTSTHHVITDEHKASRVHAGLGKKLSTHERNTVMHVWLSETGGSDALLFRYLVKLFSTEASIEHNYTDADVMAVHSIAANVTGEAHLMMGFARFQKTADNIYFAPLAPRHNVLPLLVRHFRDRFGDQAWVLYDVGRGYGLFHEHGNIRETFVNPESIGTRGALNPEALAEDEILFQDLWKRYFSATAISERVNPRLQARCMPRRYWQYLTETPRAFR